jgi:hypothetical protein
MFVLCRRAKCVLVHRDTLSLYLIRYPYPNILPSSATYTQVVMIDNLATEVFLLTPYVPLV